jgi:hypothetical protein
VRGSAAWCRTGCLLSLLGLGGCGYSVGFSAPADIRTVAVAVVGNSSFRQRLERDLTRSIARQISEYSGLRLAPRSEADALLEVEIVAVRNTTLVTGVGRPVDEGSVDAVARIRLVERRTGETLVDRHLRDIAEYRVLIGQDESSARTELVADLGRAIVLALEGGS